MPRTIRPSSYGTPDVLEVIETPLPQPGAGDVVVRVEAAGVNPIDWKLYSGAFHAVDDEHKTATGLTADSMPKLGFEAAGVVVAAGQDAGDAAAGDEVIVFPATAAYADYLVAPVTSLVPKPAGLGWAEAGSLMLAATTAFHALHAADVGATDAVLVHGGAGGVGLVAVQLAVGRGATVVATAAERNHELLRDLGAIPIAYGPGLLERARTAAPAGITAALDLAGTDEALDTSLALVPDPARIASIAGGPRRAPAGIRVLGNAPGQDAGTGLRNAARAELAAAAGDGTLRVLVAATFALDHAADAHRAGLAGHAPGKLVLVP